MALYTILGANGTIANALIPVLQREKVDIRLVSRNPKPVDGIETMKADMLKTDQVLHAISGSNVVILTVGLQYNSKVWASEWPVIMCNVIDACKATGAKLIFFDNAYMYGKTDGVITETSLYNAVSKKGRIRASIARMLEKKMQEGSLKAIIARAVDFYGPNVTDKSAPGVYVLSNLKKGKRAQWPINADVPRSFNYVPDAAEALWLLANKESAFGQIWHLPSALPALTGREFIKVVSQNMGGNGKVTVLPKWIFKIMGLFVPFIREAYELNYQDEYPFIFSSEKFEKAFDFTPTSYDKGIKQTSEWFMSSSK
ncbi:Nucleoside-diphosphate-sugar epimerase [uncultured Dysgonomonas sp.]|uniref:Nucleoside-diphosphate-sugar epimerase n=1 Tax=uncultured Dysgonomonas sp. TaxID=206096 RepID=A0A212K1D3_9BACT|nr:NAD-dependent epimerase/dehydratase family protein [uncultured Dysgonomonas sp.]SBW05473.1 Nucleoside-diphosphate-sugar epimerase [uncultured Dysgonomonas sp.]